MHKEIYKDFLSKQDDVEDIMNQFKSRSGHLFISLVKALEILREANDFFSIEKEYMDRFRVRFIRYKDVMVFETLEDAINRALNLAVLFSLSFKTNKFMKEEDQDNPTDQFEAYIRSHRHYSQLLESK